MKRSQISILVSHETSGVTRRAFRERGFDAWSCDLLPSDDDSEYHIQGDALKVYKQRRWNGLLAHPDCTYLTVSGLHWNHRGVMVNGVPRAEMTERALKHVRAILATDIDFIGLENPQGCISTRIRKEDDKIQPYEFGDDASKLTCLWTKNLPKMVKDPKLFVPPRMVCKDCGETTRYAIFIKHACCEHCLAENPKKGAKILLPRWANQTDSGQNKLGPTYNEKGEDIRWKLRSATYPGIGKAWAEQYGDHIARALA